MSTEAIREARRQIEICNACFLDWMTAQAEEQRLMESLTWKCPNLENDVKCRDYTIFDIQNMVSDFLAQDYETEEALKLQELLNELGLTHYLR